MMRACLFGFLATIAILHSGAAFAESSIHPATAAPHTEISSIESILKILAPVNVHTIDRRTEQSLKEFSAWKEQLYQAPRTSQQKPKPVERFSSKPPSLRKKAY